MKITGLEVEKVAEYTDYDGTRCEPIRSPEDQEAADEEALAQFWTTYARFDNGEVMALKDFDTKAEADELADSINDVFRALKILYKWVKAGEGDVLPPSIHEAEGGV